MGLAYTWQEQLFVISPEDKELVRGILEKQPPTIKKNPFCKNGFRVEWKEKITHLAALMVPHLSSEVVRPKDGDWFNLTRENLQAVSP